MPSFLHFCCLFVASIIYINSYIFDSQSITDSIIDFALESSSIKPQVKSNANNV